MRVSGFTIVKDAVNFDYPVVESIQSILPLVDEMIVTVGQSEDGTSALIEKINSDKLKIIPSIWDPVLKQEGKVLAVETDKAMDACTPGSDWLFYIQADEVLHEKYINTVKQAMEKYLPDHDVQGLLFNYLHFYGSYKYIADGRKWYTKEIRVIRNDRAIRAYKDAQGFRKNGRKLMVKPIKAAIYHYGWVKNPVLMEKKRAGMSAYWGNGKTEIPKPAFDYAAIDSLELFNGSHPATMEERIKSADWDFNFNLQKKQFKNLKHRLLYFLDKQFGWRPFEYRNYKII